MERLDRLSGVFWLIISMAVCIHAVGLGLGDLRNPGVGFLFFWSGVILGILSLILLGMALRRRKEVTETSAPPWENVNWVKKGAVLFALVGYGLVFEWLGFLAVTVAISLVSYGLILPFLILSFACAFYRERLKHLLRLPATDSSPAAAAPVPVAQQQTPQ